MPTIADMVEAGHKWTDQELCGLKRGSLIELAWELTGDSTIKQLRSYNNADLRWIICGAIGETDTASRAGSTDMVRTETIRGFIKACGGMVFRVVSVSTQTLCQRDGVGHLAENMKKGGILSEWLIDDEAGRRWRAVLRKGGKLGAVLGDAEIQRRPARATR